MGRKKKKKKAKSSEAGEAAPPGAPESPKHISRPFAEALRGLKIDEEAARKEEPEERSPAEAPKKRPEAPGAPPPPTEAKGAYGYEDRAAFNVAFADVAPLGGKRRRKGGRSKKNARASEAPRRVARAAVDAHARAKLASLVAGGLRFEVRREDGWVEGAREDAPPGRLSDLRNGRATPEAELDLHGDTGDEAVKRLIAFLRAERKRGRAIVGVIHGKGLHSEGGVGVLGDRIVDAITRGNAGPLVHAFTTASRDRGGSGALLLRLETR